MKLIEHFVGGKIVPGSSDKKGKVFNPATGEQEKQVRLCLLYTSPSPRDLSTSRMPSSA